MSYLISKTKRVISFLLLNLFALTLILSMVTQTGMAWAPERMIVPAGSSEPTLDGIKGSTEDWSTSGKFNRTIQPKTGSFPDMEFNAMTYNNSLFILIEVKVTNPTKDQYIQLLLSNSTASNPEDFIDAKLIQNRNLTESGNHSYITEDRHFDLDSSSYLNDTSQDFWGAANVSGPNKYTYYEFKIPFSLKNNDKENDTSISGGGMNYSIKVQYGDYPVGGTQTVNTSPVLELQIGVVPLEGESTLGEYKIDINIVSNIMFIIAGISFGSIVILSFQARKKVG